MSDFFQSKSIITLQSLHTNTNLEMEVVKTAKKIVVVVPCSLQHFQLKTVHHLLHQLDTVVFLHEIIVILNGDNHDDASASYDLTHNGLTPVTLINTLSSAEIGKGFALTRGFDYVYKHYQDSAVVVTLDADIQSFSAEYLLKLVYPIAVLNGHFNKGYYARFSNKKLDGRLTRLLVFPLLYAIQLQHPANALLEWLLAFRYPLSGDVCFASQLIPYLTIARHWAYDLSLLMAIYEIKQEIDVYQTELSDNYEHLHRSIEQDDASGLMEIVKNIVDYLIGLYPLNKPRLAADYQQLASDYCDKYQKLALFNGFMYSQDMEKQLVAKIVTYLFVQHGSSC